MIIKSMLDLGNAKARARMCILYGLAGVLSHGDFHNKRVRVIGTGNLSEDFIGYDTKGGDALADFHPIGRLFKSEVYQMLEHYRDLGVINEEHIDRIPSAGLWDGQTDEGELGHTYNEMEPIVKNMLSGDRINYNILPAPMNEDKWPLIEFIKGRHEANKHKHAAIPSFDIQEFVN